MNQYENLEQETNPTASVTFPGFFAKGHTIPDKRQQFMKLIPGKNRFRFISEPVSGYLFFGTTTNEDGVETVKPHRRAEQDGSFSTEEMISLGARLKPNGELEGQKYFIMAVVYNYQTDRFQVLEITQKKILKALKSYVENEDYGHPAGYDITITREGEGLHTNYTVIPSPPKALGREIAERATSLSYNLSKVFTGEYPLE